MSKELVQFNVKIPKELKMKIKIISATSGFSTQDLVEILLNLGIKEFEK